MQKNYNNSNNNGHFNNANKGNNQSLSHHQNKAPNMNTNPFAMGGTAAAPVVAPQSNWQTNNNPKTMSNQANNKYNNTPNNPSSNFNTKGFNNSNQNKGPVTNNANPFANGPAAAPINNINFASMNATPMNINANMGTGMYMTPGMSIGSGGYNNLNQMQPVNQGFPNTNFGLLNQPGQLNQSTNFINNDHFNSKGKTNVNPFQAGGGLMGNSNNVFLGGGSTMGQQQQHLHQPNTAQIDLQAVNLKEVLGTSTAHIEIEVPNLPEDDDTSANIHSGSNFHIKSEDHSSLTDSKSSATGALHTDQTVEEGSEVAELMKQIDSFPLESIFQSILPSNHNAKSTVRQRLAQSGGNLVPGRIPPCIAYNM